MKHVKKTLLFFLFILMPTEFFADRADTIKGLVSLGWTMGCLGGMHICRKKVRERRQILERDEKGFFLDIIREIKFYNGMTYLLFAGALLGGYLSAKYIFKPRLARLAGVWGVAGLAGEKRVEEIEGSFLEGDKEIVVYKEFCTSLEKLIEKKRNELNEKIRFNNPFIQKIILQSEEQVVIIGDIHGYPRSLLRVLSELEKMGILVDGVLAEGSSLCFTGDYSDRGLMGRLVLSIVADLDFLNPGRVFLLKGNHEDVGMNRFYGFIRELDDVFKEDYGEVEGLLRRFYSVLSSALYVGNGLGYVQLSHGFMPVDQEGGLLPIRPGCLLADFLAGESLVCNVSQRFSKGLLWSDPAKNVGVFQTERGLPQLYDVSPINAAAFGLLGCVHGHTHIPDSVKIEEVFEGKSTFIEDWQKEEEGLYKKHIVFRDGAFYHVINMLKYDEEVDDGGFVILGCNEESNFVLDCYRFAQ